MFTGAADVYPVLGGVGAAGFSTVEDDIRHTDSDAPGRYSRCLKVLEVL